MGAPSVRSPEARRGVGALAVVGLLMLLAGCGSSQVKEKLVLAADTTTTETQTVTEPARTVTAPARTETVTKTETKTEPGKTTTIESHTTTVAVKPTSTNGGGSSGGIPGWGWVLIGAGAVLLAVAVFMIGRSHGQRGRDTGSAYPAGHAPGSDWDQPRTPPRGPPEDPI
jgi:hypothetical protein